MAQIWLPDACLTTRRAAQPITKVVAEWASDWFKTSPWQVLGNWDEASPVRADEFKVLGRVGGMEITGNADAENALALAMLGCEDQAVATSDDKDLVAKLGKRAIKDLEERIAEFLPQEADTAASRFS
ncbi:MAG: hypothetical protein AAFY42_10370, partial [Pseudomonadota bacterium]